MPDRPMGEHSRGVIETSLDYIQKQVEELSADVKILSSKITIDISDHAARIRTLESTTNKQGEWQDKFWTRLVFTALAIIGVVSGVIAGLLWLIKSA